jgi:hypothetical protein
MRHGEKYGQMVVVSRAEKHGDMGCSCRHLEGRGGESENEGDRWSMGRWRREGSEAAVNGRGGMVTESVCGSEFYGKSAPDLKRSGMEM